MIFLVCDPRAPYFLPMAGVFFKRFFLVVFGRLRLPHCRVLVFLSFPLVFVLRGRFLHLSLFPFCSPVFFLFLRNRPRLFPRAGDGLGPLFPLPLARMLQKPHAVKATLRLFEPTVSFL